MISFPSYLNSRSCGNIVNKQFEDGCISSLPFLKKLKLLEAIECHEGCVNAINFSECGSLIASGSDDLHLCVSDVYSGQTKLKYLTSHTNNIFQSKFMPQTGSTEIITSSRDGSVKRCVLREGEVVESNIGSHADSCHKLCVTSKYEVLSAGEDGVVLHIDTREPEHSNNKIVHCKEGDNTVALYSIDLNPNNEHQFIVSGHSASARVYDRRHLKGTDNTELYMLNALEGVEEHSCDGEPLITCCKYNYNGTEVILSYNNSTIYLYNLSNPSTVQHSYKGHRNCDTIKGVNYYGARSEYVMSGSDCGHVFFWCKESEEIVQLIEGEPGGIVNCVEGSPTAPVLASSGMDSAVVLWAPLAEHQTDLSELPEVVEQNKNAPSNGYNLTPDRIMYLLMRANQLHEAESDSDDDVRQPSCAMS